MPARVEDHKLWEKAKKTIAAKISLQKTPQKYYAAVTVEYKKLGGKFIKPGPKGKRSRPYTKPNPVNLKTSELKKIISSKLGYPVHVRQKTGAMKDYFRLRKPGASFAPVGKRDHPEQIKIKKILTNLGARVTYYSNMEFDFTFK